MRFLILLSTVFLLLILITENISAQGLFETFDTIPAEKYKLTQNEFIKRYAIVSYDSATNEEIYDDTLQALINIYFQKRDNGSNLIINSLYLFPFSTFYGLIEYISHGRKNLYRLIMDYKNGYLLPPDYTKKIIKELEDKSWKYRQ